MSDSDRYAPHDWSLNPAFAVTAQTRVAYAMWLSFWLPG